MQLLLPSSARLPACHPSPFLFLTPTEALLLHLIPSEQLPMDASVVIPPSSEIVVDKLRDLVSSDDSSNDVHIHATALFARLKALNRSANAATRAHKQATADARHDMDQTYLGLQNLQYEKRHLEREIEKCRQFACVHFTGHIVYFTYRFPPPIPCIQLCLPGYPPLYP